MSEQPHKSPSAHIRQLLIVYVWLMILLAATVIASKINLGELNIVLTMLIAVVKATMVILIFMHVLDSGKLVWIFASAAFVWLVILLAMTFNDYVSRDRIPKSTPFFIESREVEPAHR